MVSERESKKASDAMIAEFEGLSLSGETVNRVAGQGGALDRFENARKEPAKRRQQESLLTSNLHKIETHNRRIYRYDVTQTLVIKCEDVIKKEIDMTPKKSNSDVERNIIRQNALMTVIKDNDLLPSYSDYCYDGAATMFSVLEIPKNGPKMFEVDVTAMSSAARLFKRHENNILSMRVTLKSAGSPFTPNDETVDINVRKQFLEIVTSFPFLRNGFFEMGSTLYAHELPRNMVRTLGYGLETRCGLSKSVRFIQGSDKEPGPYAVPHLNLDVSNSMFYEPRSVRETALTICKRCSPREQFRICFQQLDEFFKGLRLEYEYNEKRFQFVACGTTDKPIRDLTQDKDGVKVRYLDSFDNGDRDRMDTRLPAIVMKTMHKNTKKEYYFAMEFVRVANYQKVPISKNYVDPPTALRTADRLSMALEYMHEGGFMRKDSSFHKYLNNFGVSIIVKEIRVAGFKKEKPKIMYSSGKPISPKADSGAWRIDVKEKYIVPGHCDTLYFAYRCPPEQAERASLSIVKLLTARGFKMKRYEGVSIRKFSDLEKLFASARSDTDFNFIIFFDGKYNKDHDRLKLIEREYEVASQQVVSDTAASLPNKPATLSNIVNKINLKCGGLNHSIIPDSFSSNRWLNSSDMLIMGYDVAHPTGAPSRAEKLGETVTPSVVGLSWNGSQHLEGFVGDYAFQEPRKEAVNGSILNIYVKHMLDMFHKSNPLPKYFVIVRDGVSEGQYAMVLREEFEYIKEACEEFARVRKTEWIPKFMIFVVTKRHNIRLYQDKNGAKVNCDPGTVADTVIVKKDVSEFYMLSHRVVQGTGKFPSYQILLDEIDISMDEAQSLMHALTYNHQIIEAPISLPEPVYQADLWADRGARIFKVWNEQYQVPRTAHGNVDYAKLTDKLSLRNSRLARTRINA